MYRRQTPSTSYRKTSRSIASMKSCTSGKAKERRETSRPIPVDAVEVRAPVVESAQEVVLEQGRGVLPPRHPVGGVELQPDLVGVVEGDLETVDPLLAENAPALVPQPVAPAAVVGGVDGVDSSPHPAVVVVEVAVGELPVDPAEVGVPIRLQLTHHLLRGGGPEAHEYAECVVVGKEALVRGVPAVGDWSVVYLSP